MKKVRTVLVTNCIDVINPPSFSVFVSAFSTNCVARVEKGNNRTTNDGILVVRENVPPQLF